MQVLIAVLVLALTLQAASADTIYVSNEQDNTVSVIDGKTSTLAGTIPVGRRPRGYQAAYQERKPTGPLASRCVALMIFLRQLRQQRELSSSLFCAVPRSALSTFSSARNYCSRVP